MTGRVNPLFTKEFRALAPVFLGTAVVVLVCGLGKSLILLPVGVIGYAAGGIVLGSLTVGHEYAYDTLGAVLAQPGARRLLLAAKFAILIVLLFALAGLAAASLNDAPRWLAGGEDAAAQSVWRLTVLVLPPMLAIGVAPWLSMKCESALAAAVFTLALYAVIWSAARTIAPALPGDAPVLTPAAILTLLTMLLAGGAAVAGWRCFMRLEATGRHVTLTFTSPRRTTAAAAHQVATRRPLRALILKELRLQQVAFILSALYVGGWTIATGAEVVFPQVAGVFAGITMLFRALVAVLAGALASAEERASGTLGVQSLQPYAAWKQWTVKVLVSVGVALVLGGALPTLLDAIHPPLNGSTWFGVRILTIPTGLLPSVNIPAFSPIGLLTTLTLVALYVSSTSRSALNALLRSTVLAAVAIGTFGALCAAAEERAIARFDVLNLIHAAIERMPQAHFNNSVEIQARSAALDDWWHFLERTTLAGHGILAAAWLLPLIVCGFRNHRSFVEPRTVVHQMAWFALVTATCAVLTGALEPLLIVLRS